MPRAAAPLDRLAARLVAPTGLVALTLAAVWLFVVLRAPEDAAQGVIQKVDETKDAR